MARQHLVEQQAALVDFLDDLLTEPTEDDVQVDDNIPPASENTRLTIGLPGDIAEDGRAGLVVDEPGLVGSSGRIPIIPAWAGKAFQAMVFKVRDLSLAIPLAELAGVVAWQPELIDSQGANGLCLGRYRHEGEPVKVIDTARFIFPDERLPVLAGPGESPRLSHIILIDNGNIGLACDAVFEVISIQSRLVNWRSNKTRRQWLAGTMLDQLVAVLDARSTADILSAYTLT